MNGKGGELDLIQVFPQFKPSGARREGLPPSAVSILKTWFLSHSERPYPTEAAKRALAEEAGITVSQVSTWFTNYRRRVWRRKHDKMDLQRVNSSDSLQQDIEDGLVSKFIRSSLPKKSVEVLKTWLRDHIDTPYPSESQKQELAVQAEITKHQVSHWFVNARRRLLPRMRSGGYGYGCGCGVEPARKLRRMSVEYLCADDGEADNDGCTKTHFPSRALGSSSLIAGPSRMTVAPPFDMAPSFLRSVSDPYIFRTCRPTSQVGSPDQFSMISSPTQTWEPDRSTFSPRAMGHFS
eukprot:TRINITY_DN49818_c0_g1_i1.p1 TRINITY_DN49818_c0_g1~~TRINITY_DN49818_c0_g1_i1.p1  ORF type:complete len:294 (+),score=68.89 TRINITY_DN49818_c0_g1_i1:252-1133(+)